MLSFSDALEQLQRGHFISRSGWNGKGMYLALVSPTDYGFTRVFLNDTGTEDCDLKPWIMMRTADSGLVPWLASQTDILANDWQTVEF